MPETAPKAVAKPPATKKQPRLIKWSEFEKRYLSREDGYKYEWLHGRVEKTEYTMNPTQLYIQRNLTALFRFSLNAGKVHGELLAEPEDLHLQPLLIVVRHVHQPERGVQVLDGDARPQAVEHIRDVNPRGVGHLQGACHVFGHAWALIRPDGYLAATGEAVDANLVHAVETALAVPTFL